VITLHGALSPTEKAPAQSPASVIQMQEFHRQLFTSSCRWLRQEIKRITGVEVRGAAAEVETTACSGLTRLAGSHERIDDQVPRVFRGASISNERKR
jgi:hypothetical protein